PPKNHTHLRSSDVQPGPAAGGTLNDSRAGVCQMPGGEDTASMAERKKIPRSRSSGRSARDANFLRRIVPLASFSK
ncbi:MAG: hypothetical protein U1E27_13200, partial [Kiritimatiellia bacterium]|nr:hypothetical protein [Kiritimatiellia bacterium]